MEMEIKSAKDENLRNSMPFVKQLSTDSAKAKVDYAINGDTPYAPTTQRIYLWTQLFAAFAVSMGSLIVGFSSGYTSPAIPNMMDPSNNNSNYINITQEEKTWIGGLLPLAALAGGVAGGPLIEILGRRTTIMMIALPFFIGWMLIANAPKVIYILAGRAFCGICVGIGSLAFPVYLGETVQPEVRGAIGLLPTAFGNIGILLAYFLGTYLDWSKLAFFGGALSVPFFLLMIIIPETPRWYVTKGRSEDARKKLQWLRGKNINIEKEMQDLTLSQAEADRQGGNVFKILFSKKYAPAVLITLGLMLFQQLSGINAVIFYAGEILQNSNSSIDKNISSIIIGVVNFVSTFIAAALIDRLGRKILLYVSSVSMITTLVTLGVYYYLLTMPELRAADYGWIPLACLVIYVLGFSIGFGPIPWLMLGEILPSRIRGTAASLATAFNWTCTFIVTKTFDNIVLAIGMYGTVWMYSVICFIGLFFVIFFVPETRGRSLEDIEKILTGGSRRSKINNSSNRAQNAC